MPTSYHSPSPIAKIADVSPLDSTLRAVHRVDAPHPLSPDPLLPGKGNGNPVAVAAGPCAGDHYGSAPPIDQPMRVAEIAREADQSICHSTDGLVFDPAQLRTAHTEDLIEFLQQWSEDLDDRTARLNADIATHERRERAFRLWMQNRRLELEVQIAEYRQAQSQAELIARRLAIGG